MSGFFCAECGADNLIQCLCHVNEEEYWDFDCFDTPEKDFDPHLDAYENQVYAEGHYEPDYMEEI